MVERISTKRKPDGSILEREFVVDKQGVKSSINFTKTAKGYDFNEYSSDSINYNLAFSDIKTYLDKISRDNETNLFCMAEKEGFKVNYITEHEKPYGHTNRKATKQIKVEVSDSVSKVIEVIFNRTDKDMDLYVKNIKYHDRGDDITNNKLYATYVAYNEIKDDYDVNEIPLFEEYGDS
jgi:hypothetical protein